MTKITARYFLRTIIVLVGLVSIVIACARAPSIPTDYQLDTSEAGDLCHIQFIHPKEWGVEDASSGNAIFLRFYASSEESISQAQKMWKFVTILCSEEAFPEDEAKLFTSNVLASLDDENVTM